MDEGTSINDLFDLMDLDYYDQGAADALFGPGWQERNQSALFAKMVELHRDNLFAAIQADMREEPDVVGAITVSDVNMQFQDVWLIMGTWKIHIDGNEPQTLDVSEKWVGTDTDGDNVEDSWVLAGSAF